jgi:hypothetical protein
MTALLLVCLAGAAPIGGMGFVQLQARLERWAYERHVDD